LPTEIAVSVSSSTDVVISEANVQDVEEVLGSCRADRVRPVLPVAPPAEVTLLVRVERDGRVTDSEIEIGSGVPRMDEAAARCLLAHGALSPRRINGAPVASWQRVHWPARSS
jgi:TonB family protein